MRNVLVTGGSRGLGLGIARGLAERGFRVIAVARRATDEWREAAGTLDGAMAFHAFDLAGIARIKDMVKSLRAEFGPLYGLVNNAAIGESGMLSTMPDARIEGMVRLNVVSPITLTKYVVRAMMADASGGRIVNIASIVGATGYSGLAAYSATKASLFGFTRSLAREVGPLGITVNAVAPGFVATEMTHGMQAAQREQVARRSALRRLPEIGDVAGTVAFLFSDAARNITGTVTTVDAGNTA
jgi:3-oxoacyl-[acyl-carrier protein] reductase